MNSKTLVLLLFIALTAFVLGFAVNSPQSGEASEVALLNARLLQTASLADEPTTVSIDELRDGLTVVNFWATWCAPCRDEMPMFEAVYRAQQASPAPFTIVGVTIDSVDNAIPMLEAMDISYPIVYAELTGSELMSALGNPQGLLPYTVVINGQGRIVEQKMGRVHEEDLLAWIATHSD